MATVGRTTTAEHLDALIAAVRTRGPLVRADLRDVEGLRGTRPNQLERLIEEAAASGAIELDGERLVAVANAAVDETSGPRGGPVRIVAIDFEAVVRTTAQHPYVERRAFQVGALRFGRDWDWVHQRRSMTRFCTLPEPGEGAAWQIYSPEIAARHANEAVDGEVWLAELDAVLEGADVVVAYNGFQLDFPLLDEERQRAGLPPISGVDLVDGYVLALSVWPNPPNNHRLARLAERLEVRLERYTWHNALSDCRLLATVIWAGARTIRRWDETLSDLVLNVCDDSCTWQMLADLARIPASGRGRSEDDVAMLLGDELAAHQVSPRRRLADADGNLPLRPPIAVAGELIGADGRVDPHRLAETVRGESLARREAQGTMADLVGTWIAADAGGLIEAPTGTGKSLVLLAAAMDWVRGGSERQAIIATHTKQLQSQLARDVQRLVDAGVSALSGSTDLVKGASNRLSVRALTLALSDASSHRREGQLRHPEMRELLAYLTIRFVTADTLTERWLASSVDSVDIPVVFSGTARGLLGVWLRSVSQHDQGEYRPDGDTPVTLHTDRVSEALAAHQIVIANHALLLAHREALAALGDGLVVLVDEAHELENAATEALSQTFDYQALERIPNEMRRLVADADDHEALRRAGEAAQQLRRFLEQAVLPNAALRALDGLSEPGSEPGRRAATIASPYAGQRGMAPIDTLRANLAHAGSYLAFLRRRLAHWANDDAGLAAADRWTAERFRAASTSVYAQFEAIEAVLADLEILLGPMRRVRRSDGSSETDDLSTPDSQADEGDVAADDEALVAALDLPSPGLSGITDPNTHPEGDGDVDAEVVDAVEGDEDDREDDDSEVTASDDATEPSPVDARPDPALRAGVGNRVVWLADADSPDLTRGSRNLRFSVTTSPVSLGADLVWREFLEATPRLVLTSGTLRVSDGWEFILGRLGLGAATPTAVLPTPFDHGTQARLFCLADFPSWAEHPTRAVRTVAHQITGWARLASRPHPDGGRAGGAMVLTTSRATAAAIAMEAAPMLSAADVPLSITETLGNARAVDTFQRAGGVLVGTRGLWQGVDVSDPERLRVVWINKLPFAPFADPIVAARRARAAEIAARRGCRRP